MGHIRLGRLPKSKRWQTVVGLMESDAGSASRIAAATLLASEAYLRTLGADSAVVRAYGLLVGLMTAARQGEFASEAARLGLRGEAGTSSLAFLASVADIARSEAAAEADGSQAGEFAALALRRALMDTVATQSVGLFGSTVATAAVVVATAAAVARAVVVAATSGRIPPRQLRPGRFAAGARTLHGMAPRERGHSVARHRGAARALALGTLTEPGEQGRRQPFATTGRTSASLFRSDEIAGVPFHLAMRLS